jgi:hypothetical protein
MTKFGLFIVRSSTKLIVQEVLNLELLLDNLIDPLDKIENILQFD